jgi:hypothetical protein
MNVPLPPQADALAEFQLHIGSADTENASAEPVPVTTLHKMYLAAKAAALGKLDEGGVFHSTGVKSADQTVHQQRGQAQDAASMRRRFKDTLKLECVTMLAQYAWQLASDRVNPSPLWCTLCRYSKRVEANTEQLVAAVSHARVPARARAYWTLGSCCCISNLRYAVDTVLEPRTGFERVADSLAASLAAHRCRWRRGVHRQRSTAAAARLGFLAF